MNNLSKKLILIIGLLIFNSTTQSQDLDLYFDHINYDDGFPQSMISSIEQTENGFIWIGTETGLVRYDGYNFLRYTRENKDGSISNNHINVVYEDFERKLWIGTNNGVNFFNKKTNKFLQVDIPPIKGGRNYISSMTEDYNNNLWIGTFGGVKRLNKEKYILENISSNSNSELFNSSRVLFLFCNKELGMLVGTAQGLKRFNPETGEVLELPKELKNNEAFSRAKIWKIVVDSNGDIWFGTESMGAYLFSEKDKKLIQFSYNQDNPNSIASNWIHDIVDIDDNTKWFATNNGLSIYKKDKNIFTNHKHNQLSYSSLSDNNIISTLKDRDGSIWLGTSGGGVNFFNKANLNFVNIGETIPPNFGLTTPRVGAIEYDDDKSVWVGTYGNGLNQLDFKNKKSYSFTIENVTDKNLSNTINTLANIGTDYLLCGTMNGAYMFNKKTKKFKKVTFSTNASSLNDRQEITALLVDKNDVWIGTLGFGMHNLKENGTIETYKTTDSNNTISDNFIVDFENRKDAIWIATQDGLNFFDKKLKEVTAIYKNEENDNYSLSNNTLTTLFTDSKNRLWLGTDFGGLNYFDEETQRFFVINKSLGFTDEIIKNISEDSSGNLWVTSNDKLFKIRFKNFSTPFAEKDLEITSYSSKDGLTSKQFMTNCNIKLENNNLVFGGSEGLTIFNPNNMGKSCEQHEIVFTNFIINNQEIEAGESSTLKSNISETSEITLNYDQDYVSLEFSALNFIKPESTKYAYKLDNSSRKDEWHNIGNQHTVNLTALNSDTYFLNIKSSNEDGVWNQNIKTLKIKILPPFWKTWWAFLIYFILFAASSVIVFRFTSNKIKLKRQLFLEHVENERQQELNDMQLNFFTNISHEIRTPLTLINGPIEELIESTSNNAKAMSNLKTIKHNSDRLLKLVNELLDIRKAEKGLMNIYCEKQDIVSFCFEIYETFKGISVEKNIEYKFVINSNSVPVYFDKNQMEKVVYNLLSNAFKFTKKNGKIVLSVEKDPLKKDWVHIKVKDNGIGIPEHSKNNIFNRFFQVDDRGVQNLGSGVGLALSKNIVELHDGEISIPDEKETWANTVFQISLRLGNSHLNKTQIIQNDDEVTEKVIDSENVNLETELESPINKIDSVQNFDESKKTILLIEDNEEVRNFIKTVIVNDYNVLEFSNGLDALKYMEKEIPDLIISDIMMPEMDGLELCRIVKSNETTNHIPVILLTAKSSTDNRIEGLSTGADSYITKPFSTKVLKLNIVNLLSAKEILKHKYSGNFIIDSDLEKLDTPEELFIKKLMTIIETNLENPEFDVKELVKEIGMSRTILYKKVSSLTNHSVASLIKQIRLKKATDIILNTTYPISEVAFMVGFNDRKHFSREFKKVYNMSPTVYKKNHSNV